MATTKGSLLDVAKEFASLGVVGTALFPVGILLLELYLTYSARQAMRRVTARRTAEGSDGSAEAAGAGGDDGADARCIGRARSLMRDYKDKYWFWEPVDTLRKYLLTAVVPVVANVVTSVKVAPLSLETKVRRKSSSTVPSSEQ